MPSLWEGPEALMADEELQALLKAKLAEFRKTLTGKEKDLAIFDERLVAVGGLNQLSWRPSKAIDTWPARPAGMGGMRSRCQRKGGDQGERTRRRYRQCRIGPQPGCAAPATTRRDPDRQRRHTGAWWSG